jgi:hypothetical protein
VLGMLLHHFFYAETICSGPLLFPKVPFFGFYFSKQKKDQFAGYVCILKSFQKYLKFSVFFASTPVVKSQRI